VDGYPSSALPWLPEDPSDILSIFPFLSDRVFEPKVAKTENNEKSSIPEKENVPKVDALDLDDLELGSGAKFMLSPEATTKKY
jgi:hypothetical protein